jgi:lysyl-tRNA synthetase class 1
MLNNPRPSRYSGSMAEGQQAVHWADVYAEQVIREKGDKELYVAASGITPSGTVHIGNFREIISVELVVRALRQHGKKVRFIYSWDDYDVFRKIPKNMPKQEMLAGYLRQPITRVPDPYGREDSYARHNEREVEELLPVVGIFPEYIYQFREYGASRYAEGIRSALQHREELRATLDEHRTEALAGEWWPISIFCTRCGRDTTSVRGWDGQYGVSYSCKSCKNEESLDLRSTGAVKLLWRVDWPMRWAYQRVDFEPAGKDHHTEGGSFDTGREIVKRVYGFEAPTSFQYDFIGIKGGAGKISSSSGEVVSLRDVLQVYQPEVVRFLFASSRPNTEFAISFDLDVLKIYEDYDRCERVFFAAEQAPENRAAREKRTYELSQVREVPASLPTQVGFRHLCNLVCIWEGDPDKVLASLDLHTPTKDQAKVRTRAVCAWNWVRNYAPESFRFRLRPAGSQPLDFGQRERKALRLLAEEVREKLAGHDEKSLAEAIYRIAAEAGMDSKEFFKTVYRALIEKEQGPRLAGFLLILGRERVLDLLGGY